jgi:NADH dehydrogenase (ubiquinone) 1 alpha subcomplex subunit 8
MRENCLTEFDAHWRCLEWNNQKYNQCRKPERTLNKCMFEKLVRTAPSSQA